MADTKKILVAEDDTFLSTLLKNRLVRDGFDVTVVSRGDEVVPTLKKQKTDLILLDIILPGRIGYDIIDDLEEAKIKTPFMIISNLAQDEDVQRAKKAGAVDYFVKAHVAIDDLVKRVSSFLNAK